MEPIVFAAVLFAAALHAGWNALLKLKLEPLLAITLVSVGAGLVAVPLLPFVPFPDAAAWPFIAGSLVIHLAYYVTLGEAYRTGDLSQVYPIARGTAPLLTAGGAALVLGENLSPVGWAGIVLLAAGVVMLSLRGGRSGARIESRAVVFALLTALSIAAYTVIDGTGARHTASVLSYIGWLCAADGLMMLTFGALRFRGGMRDALAGNWLVIVGGGALSTGAYGIAIWAMTKAPIALVAALRETSVLFAALIGVVLLREPLAPLRLLATVVVLAGVMLVRLR